MTRPDAPAAPLLALDGIGIGFETGGAVVAAIEDFSLTVDRGEVVGLVGESGSGKTLVSLAVMGLLPPGAVVTSGTIRLRGADLLSGAAGPQQRLRGGTNAMIFQDPMASLDPVFTCGQQVMEAIRLHDPVGRGEARRRALELFDQVRLPDPGRALASYPHELSGGQCQRVMIAMALACRPALIIADEPTTALDVTVQAQVLKLLRDIQRDTGTAILFITHDLGVVYEMTDRVAVLYAGRLMEEAATPVLFDRPGHPYTRALIGAIPAVGARRPRLAAIDGRVPAIGQRPAGCGFAPRCGLAVARCHAEVPPETVAAGARQRCWLAGGA
jgi:oligopeptide/dipeptide ABC transporter ATP-binding protein